MSVINVQLTIKEADAFAVRALHRGKTLSDAVLAEVKAAVARARLKAHLAEHYPRPHAPTAATGRTLRARSMRGDKVFASGVEAAAYLRNKFS